jgi:hypothetical protein
MGLQTQNGGVTFYAQIVAATGLFLAPPPAPSYSFNGPVAPIINPIADIGLLCAPARTGAGVYTLTFGTSASDALPTSEYKYTLGLLGAPAANSNIQFSVAGNVVTVTTSVVAVATDLAWWIQIEPISG